MRHTSAGFTLVEVLVAMAVFAIASAATASMMLHATINVAENNGASQAIAFAQAVMEDLRTVDYTDIDDGAEVFMWKGKAFTVTWAVSEDDPSPGMKTIVVTVHWQDRGETRIYETETIYSQITA